MVAGLERFPSQSGRARSTEDGEPQTLTTEFVIVPGVTIAVTEVAGDAVLWHRRPCIVVICGDLTAEDEAGRRQAGKQSSGTRNTSEVHCCLHRRLKPQRSASTTHNKKIEDRSCWCDQTRLLWGLCAGLARRSCRIAHNANVPSQPRSRMHTKTARTLSTRYVRNTMG